MAIQAALAAAGPALDAVGGGGSSETSSARVDKTNTFGGNINQNSGGMGMWLALAAVAAAVAFIAAKKK